MNGKNSYEKPGENLPKPYQKRFFKVGTLSHPLGLLDGEGGNAVCGFCGQRIVIYSLSVVGDDETPQNIFYGCRANCGKLQFYRVGFVDKKIFLFIVEKLRKLFPPPKNADQSEILRILKGYSTLSELQEKHRELITQLRRAIYQTESILEKLKKVEENIEKVKSQLSPDLSSEPSQDPFFSLLWTVAMDKLQNLPLPYRREVYRSFVRRTRFYDTYLILRSTNLIQSSSESEKDMGKMFALPLNR